MGLCSQFARRANQTAVGKNQCPALIRKIFRLTRRANHLYRFACLASLRGAARDRHGRGAGCGGRGSVGAQRRLQGGFPVSDLPARRRTMQVADGEVVWS